MTYREVGCLTVIGANAGIQSPDAELLPWTPACARVTSL
jgi:hypothetical protein